MQRHWWLLAVFWCLSATAAHAIEGPTAAGPIGGTDLKSAFLPPPGLYGGTIQGYAATTDFVDGRGQTIPVLSDAHLQKAVFAPFLYYAPELPVLGGSVGIGALLPMGGQCGRLFVGTSSRCQTGLGDLYVEANWGRFFGTLRPSKDPGAFPIPEGLAVMVGLGVVFPTGDFTAVAPLSQALSFGNNTWDIAPSIAVTYTTPAIIGEGTEISAKFYWNNYLRNPTTTYQAGDLLNLDFAVSEHFGRLQFGLAGLYAAQAEDDRIGGARIPPDGRRGELFALGAVAGYDFPEYAASLKVKAMSSVIASNTVQSWLIVTGWVKKF